MTDFLSGLIAAIMESTTLDTSSLIFSDKAGTQLLGYANLIWNYLAIIGLGMTIIYFLMEMNRKLALEGRDMNLKSFFAPFLKLMVAIAVLSQGAKMVSWILSFNDTLVTWAATEFNSLEAEVGTKMQDSIMATIGNGGMIVSVIIAIPLLLCYFVAMLLQIIWWYKSIVYKLEVLFRIGITPIALADVYSGQNSNAVKWLKGFLVLGLYAMSMIVLPKLALAVGFAELTNIENVWDGIKALFTSLVAPFAALGCMSLARSAAKEALGA